ncbi:MAG TPA: polysaccharide deacetylase family protein [Ktedonobacteraceae bacterium]|nr:polysaccharide deacetylase family protein [Ktedonobacteraceae bacterium]
MSPALFAAQMAYLHQNAYTPITVTQFVNALYQKGTTLPERPVVLTFDDSFADFFSEALPVLKQYGFAATLYIVTAFINDTSRWLQREGEATRLMLTWDQLTEISAYDIECGAHSHSHRPLDTLSHTVARDEIVQCKRLLEHNLGQKVLSFAYPFGYHSAALRQLAREAGYTSACAVKHAMSSETTDPFALARIMVKEETSVDALAALLIGCGSPSIRTMYLRARTPVWRFARRCSASVIRHSRRSSVTEMQYLQERFPIK